MVVLIQIICDQNYKFCENHPSHQCKTDILDEDTDQLSQIEKQKHKRSNFKPCDQTFCHESIFDQPKPSHQPSFEKKSTLCHPNQKLNFSDQNSKLPPSFNLKSNQKSTPKKKLHFCDENCFEVVSVHSTPSRQPRENLSKQNEIKNIDSGIEIKVDVHETNDSQNETFDLL